MTASAPSSSEIGAAVSRMLANGDARKSDAKGGLEAHTQGIIAVYLFGSFARGEAKPQSDVDLGLLYESPPESTLRGQPFGLEADLADVLGRPVQCVVMNTAPPDLIHRILLDQMLLVDRNPKLRIRFEVNARNQYFDLKPFLDRYRKAERVA
jgi:predicted nucleotidyltransferase